MKAISILFFSLFMLIGLCNCAGAQHCPEGTIETGRTVGRRPLGNSLFLTTDDTRLVCEAPPAGGVK